MNPVSARLLSQQLICQQFTAPHEVVQWMGAMQAQEYRMMRWAVGMRTKKPSAKAFEKDYNEGKIVRGHLFRTTWQLVAGKDRIRELRWKIIGYKSRDIAVHPDHSHRAHNGSGIFWPVILLDGEVVGNWSVPGGKPQIDIFHRDANLDHNSLQEEFSRYQKFIMK